MPEHARPTWVEIKSLDITLKALRSHGRSKQGKATYDRALKISPCRPMHTL